MQFAIQPLPNGSYTTEPGELLPPFARPYDRSLGATPKQQFIRAELHRRAMEQEEQEEFRKEIIHDRFREMDRHFGRAIIWGMLFNAILVGVIALILALLGVHAPW